MTVHHRRTVGISGGRTAAAIAAYREWQQYHKANGVEYEVQLPFGGDASRLALAARYGSAADVQAYFQKIMSDPVFLDSLAKHAQNFIAGTARDEIWRQTYGPAQPAGGALTHIRVMGVMPGRLVAIAGIMKELVDYFASIGGGYVVAAPAGVGDPMRVALAARYRDVGALEAFSAKIQADPRWLEIVARNAVNIVPAGMSDHMWITI
jgi:hypothetical protein